MILIKARGFPQFLAAFHTLRAAGVEPVATGGNEMRVPAGTDRAVLRAVAATGAAVHADLTEPEPETAEGATEQPETEPVETEPQVDTPPTRKPRKTTTRRKTSRE